MRTRLFTILGLTGIMLIASFGLLSASAGAVQRPELNNTDVESFAFSHRVKPDQGTLPNTGGTQRPTWNAELASEMAIGLINAVAAQGNYVYIGVGPRLVVLDVSDPATPTVVGQTAVLPGTVQDVHVAGSHVYLATGSLRVIDISDPTTPVEVGSVPGSAQSVYVADVYAYVAGAGLLRVIDVSNPATPVEVGATSVPGGEVYVAGRHAYVAAGSLHVVDVSNPAAPIEVSTYGTPGDARDVFVAGSYAYVAAGEADLQIVDVTDPMSPQEVGVYEYECGLDEYICSYGDVTASSVYVVGDHAYVTWEKCTSPFGCRVSPGLRVVDVSDPTAPVAVGGRDTSGNPAGVFVAGDYAYVVERPVWWYNGTSPCTLAGSSLRALDVSNPAQLQWVGSYRPLAAATGLYVAGGYAYVADPINRLRVFDVSDPATPRKGSSPLAVRALGSPYGIGGVARDVFVTDDTVYVALGPSASGFQQVSAFPHPNAVEDARLLNGCSPPPPSQWFYRVYVLGDYAYVIDANHTLRILDVSDYPRETEVGTAGGGQSVYVAGSYAYVVGGSSLRIIDVSDPTAPAEAGYDSGGAVDVHVIGNYAYVAAGGAGLRVVDVSDPTAPAEIGAYDTPGSASDVYVAGPYAYVADGTAGLRVIDVSDPTMPLEVGAYEKVYASRVHASDGYAYVLSTNGLYIFRAPAPVSASIPPAGGRLTSPFDRTTYTFAPGMFTEPVTITHTPLTPGNASPTGAMVNIDHLFEVNAVYESTDQPAHPTQPYTVTVQYTDAEKGPAIEDTLALYQWNGTQWVREPTSTVGTEANVVTATPTHFGLWAVLGETRRMFLPVVFR